MEHEVGWLLELAVNPGQIETVRALMDEMVLSTRREAGVRVYEWFASDDGRVVAISERYAASTTVLTHLAGFGENFAQRFLAAMSPARLIVFGTPSEEAKQALSGFNPTYLGFFGGFTAQ